MDVGTQNSQKEKDTHCGNPTFGRNGPQFQKRNKRPTLSNTPEFVSNGNFPINPLWVKTEKRKVGVSTKFVA